MIKIKKVLVDNRFLGICGDNEWYYLYKGLNTKTNMYYEVIALKEDIDRSNKFEKQVRDRLKYVLNNKKGENNETTIR